jgi:Tfp pilus assembly protein PilN
LGSRPTQLERLLVDHVAVGFLAERHAEIAAADSRPSTLAQDKFRLQQAESAQRRFLTGVKMLTSLRALVPQGLAPAESPRVFRPDRKTR